MLMELLLRGDITLYEDEDEDRPCGDTNLFLYLHLPSGDQSLDVKRVAK